MAGPFEVRDTEVVNAIADTLVYRTSLLRQTTLAAPALAGATTIFLTDVTGFAERGYIQWFDDAGELLSPIKAIDPLTGQVDLDYSGYAEHGFSTGLRYAHLSGAVVATNLMLHRPAAIESMLRTGAPVLSIFPKNKRTRDFTVGSTISPVFVDIYVHRALMQFDQDPMDPEAYNELQQLACRADLQTVENAVNQNRHLTANLNNPGPHAIGLGESGSSGPWGTSMYDQVIDLTTNTPIAVAHMSVIVRPRQYIREEPGS